MFIAIGGIKGGTGKTTLALNLVIERVMQGRKVLFLDSGLAEMGLYFSKKRKNLGLPTNWDFMALNKNLSLRKLNLLSKNYDDIIIDIRIDEVCNILYLIDVLILPFRCSFLDINSLKSLMPIINSLKLGNQKLKVFGLLTQVRPRDKNEKKFMDIISGFMSCLPSLYNRIAYDRAVFNGLGVLEEEKKDLKCCNEFNTFCEIIIYKESVFLKLINYFYIDSCHIKPYFFCLTFLLILVFCNIEFGFIIFNFDFFSHYFDFSRKRKDSE